MMCRNPLSFSFVRILATSNGGHGHAFLDQGCVLVSDGDFMDIGHHSQPLTEGEVVGVESRQRGGHRVHDQMAGVSARCTIVSRCGAVVRNAVRRGAVIVGAARDPYGYRVRVVSGSDGVDPDPERHRLHRRCAGQADDGAFAGGVERRLGDTLIAEVRRNVDDNTDALALHDARFVLHRQQRCQDIAAERIRVLRCAQFNDGG